jgi:hypothetical protein
MSVQRIEKKSPEFKVRGGARPGAGRPPGIPNKVNAEVREIAREWGAAAIKQAAALAGLVMNESGEPIGKAESEQARIAALNIVLDRAYGKAPQAITGGDGGPQRIDVAIGQSPISSFAQFLADAIGTDREGTDGQVSVETAEPAQGRFAG